MLQLFVPVLLLTVPLLVLLLLLGWLNLLQPIKVVVGPGLAHDVGGCLQDLGLSGGGGPAAGQALLQLPLHPRQRAHHLVMDFVVPACTRL